MPVNDRSGFDVVRYAHAGTVRAVETDSGPVEGADGILHGHFSVFNRWYEIDSPWEGHFLERIAPGTFTDTFAADVQRCWFEHGYSTTLDHHSLGRILTLREDDIGALYEVELFSGLPRFFVEGLAAGEYGASFRMRITAESVDEDPGRSDHNPNGLPEVTITRVTCPEFGPVSIGASPHATAALRCGTDNFYEAMRSRDPEQFERCRSAAGLAPIAHVDVESDARGAGGDDANSNTSNANPTQWARAAALALDLMESR